MSASYEVRDGVAVITLDNPPVNGLSYDTRRAIADGLNKAQADAAVRAIVLTGAGKAFSGGADIREFGSPKSGAEPNLLTLIRMTEDSTKPVVAAINGVAWAAASNSRSAATTASRRPRCRSRCPR